MKTAARARMTAKRPVGLVWVEGDQCFWCVDGQILRSLMDLKHALANMTAETYRYHVTPEKNDFAQWTEVTLLDKKCAQSLRVAKTQGAAVSALEKCLAAYVI